MTKNTNIIQLVTELLETNFLEHEGQSVTPLDLERINKNSKRSEINPLKEEVYNSLKEIVGQIEKVGYISRSMYEDNRFAFNSLARDLANLRISSTCNETFCYRQDRESRNATPQQVNSFPNDGAFGEVVYQTHTNIFSSLNKESDFEGTLFHLSYEKHELQSIRLFHQAHRNSLHIKTVSSEKLVQEIRPYLSSHEEEIESQPNFTLSKEEYLRKVDEFNEKGKDKIEILLLGGFDGKFPVVKIYEQPLALSDKLLSYSEELEIKLGRNELEWGYFVSSECLEFKGCRFYFNEVIEEKGVPKGTEGNTVIMPHENAGLELKFLRRYLNDIR